VSPLKTVLVVVGASPFAAYLAAVVMNVVLNYRAGRRGVRDPKVAAAIARHPSMGRRALYPAPCCNVMLAGYDPLDLVAVTLMHEANCVEREIA
jgi:hypothetical protein